MGRESALKNHCDQAKSVEDALARIILRLNYAYTPLWLIDELEYSYRTMRCIHAERKRDLEAFVRGELKKETGA